MLELQEKGAHNINLVTPTHYVPQIAKVLHKIKNKELKIPVVYNTSSYESIGTLMVMKNLVDIYLADLRYYDDELGKKYSLCDNYFENATMAIDEMYRQVGKFQLDKNGMLKKGLVVRVLILPGHIDDTKLYNGAFKFIANIIEYRIPFYIGFYVSIFKLFCNKNDMNFNFDFEMVDISTSLENKTVDDKSENMIDYGFPIDLVKRVSKDENQLDNYEKTILSEYRSLFDN